MTTNIWVKEFKIKLADIEYTFRLDFRALIRFEAKYGTQGMVLFNEFLQGKNVYENIVKILSCACVEKEFKEDELAGLLSFDFKTMKLMDDITFALIEGLIEKPGSGGGKGKNAETSQSKKEA